MGRVKEVAKMYLIKVKVAEGASVLIMADTLQLFLKTLDNLFGEGVKKSFAPGGYVLQVRLPNQQVVKPVVAVLTKQTRTFPTVNLPTLPFSVPVAGVDG
jgi:hypothetical protein